VGFSMMAVDTDDLMSQHPGHFPMKIFRSVLGVIHRVTWIIISCIVIGILGSSENKTRTIPVDSETIQKTATECLLIMDLKRIGRKLARFSWPNTDICKFRKLWRFGTILPAWSLKIKWWLLILAACLIRLDCSVFVQLCFT
jgi:hypothetical protein